MSKRPILGYRLYKPKGRPPFAEAGPFSTNKLVEVLFFNDLNNFGGLARNNFQQIHTGR